MEIVESSPQIMTKYKVYEEHDVGFNCKLSNSHNPFVGIVKKNRTIQ